MNNTNKTIFITGSSSGIGKDAALFFAKKGWNVVATMRTLRKAPKEFNLDNIFCTELDVVNIDSIKTSFDQSIAKFGSVDVLLNNAGYALTGAFEAMSKEQIEKQFETNVFGTMNVIRQFLPYFRERKSGNIITVTSMGGLLTFPLYSPYHGTKWALEGFLESLRYELKPFGIKVKNIEPGAIKTEFYSALEFEVSEPYKAYASLVSKNMGTVISRAPGPEVVTKEIWKAANDTSNRLRYPAGANGKIFIFMRKILPFWIWDRMFSFVLER